MLRTRLNASETMTMILLLLLLLLLLLYFSFSFVLFIHSFDGIIAVACNDRVVVVVPHSLQYRIEAVISNAIEAFQMKLLLSIRVTDCSLQFSEWKFQCSFRGWTKLTIHRERGCLNSNSNSWRLAEVVAVEIIGNTKRIHGTTIGESSE